jgi:putative ABC transport system permease protein
MTVRVASSLWRLAFELGARRLRRDRGFLMFVAASLGITTALLAMAVTFSTAILFRALPFDRPESLHAVSLASARSPLAAPNFQISLHAAHALAIGASSLSILRSGVEPLSTAHGGATVSVQVDRVAPDYIALVGLTPADGRWPIAGQAEAAISASWARRLFGSSASALGRSVVLNGQPLRLTAVLPESYLRPVPLQAQRDAADSAFLVPVDEAQWVDQYAGSDQGGDASLIGRGEASLLCSKVAADLQSLGKSASWALQPACVSIRPAIMQGDSAAAAAMLIASLLLFAASLSGAALYTATRFAQRRHEQFVVDMLGASPRQARMHRTAETLLIWLSTGAVAMLFAAVAALGLGGDAAGLPMTGEDRLLGTLPALLAAWFVAGLVLMGAPVLRERLAANAADAGTWRNRRSGSFSRNEARVHRIVLLVEVAVGMAAVAVAATLLTGSVLAFRDARGQDFDDKYGVQLRMDADIPAGARDAIVAELVAGLKALPGIGVVVRSNASPIDLSGKHYSISMAIQGRQAQYELTAVAADPEYFAMFGHEPRFGRWYRADEPHAAVVTAEAQWAMVGSVDASAMSQVLAPPPEYTSVWNDHVQVVGGTRARRVHTLSATGGRFATKPIVFRPYHDELTDMTVERTAWVLFEGRDPGPEAMQRLIGRLPPGVLRYEQVDLAAVLGRRLRQHALASASTLLLAGAVLMSLVLGAFASMYGACQQRQREYGIRLALGAEPRHLRQAFARRALAWPAATACLLAVGAWWMIGSGISFAPFRINAYHAVLAAPVVLTAVIAGFLFAFRQFERQSPMEALRAE